MSISILLVDDHAILREGLQLVLSTHSDFQVVGQAADGLEALAMAESLHPDVMIVDMMMPGLSGLDVTCRIKQNLPGIRVIVLSLHDDVFYVVDVLKNGASGYVLKELISSDLAQAVRNVMEGKIFLSPPIRKYAI